MDFNEFPRVTIIGEAMIDLVHLIEMDQEQEEVISATDCVHAISGSAAVASLVAGTLGALPQLISRSGRDAVGSLFHEALEEKGISASYLDISGIKAPCRMVTVESSGKRVVSKFDGLGLTNDPSWIALPEDADIALADGGCTASAVVLLDQAKERNIPSIVCVESEIDPVVLHVATHVIMTSETAAHAFPMLSASEAATRGQAEYGGWFAVQDGAGGLAFCGPAGVGEHTQIGDAQDILGYSRDIWRAAFAVGLGLYASEINALSFADTTLVMSCQHHSGHIEVPSAWDVVAKLANESMAAE